MTSSPNEAQKQVEGYPICSCFHPYIVFSLSMGFGIALALVFLCSILSNLDEWMSEVTVWSGYQHVKGEACCDDFFPDMQNIRPLPFSRVMKKYLEAPKVEEQKHETKKVTAMNKTPRASPGTPRQRITEPRRVGYQNK